MHSDGKVAGSSKTVATNFKFKKRLYIYIYMCVCVCVRVRALLSVICYEPQHEQTRRVL